MSLISLASTRALQEDAEAEGLPRPGRIPSAADAQERVIGQLVAFIPAESVTFFIAALGTATLDARVWVRWLLFGVVCALTPFWVELHYLKKARTRRARRKVPVFEIVAGLIAFVAWSTTVPATPWSSLGGFTTRWGLIVAIGTAFVLVAASEVREALSRLQADARRPGPARLRAPRA